jgi:hypothetical protein
MAIARLVCVEHGDDGHRVTTGACTCLMAIVQSDGKDAVRSGDGVAGPSGPRPVLEPSGRGHAVHGHHGQSNDHATPRATTHGCIVARRRLRIARDLLAGRAGKDHSGRALQTRSAWTRISDMAANKPVTYRVSFYPPGSTRDPIDFDAATPFQAIHVGDELAGTVFDGPSETVARVTSTSSARSVRVAW